MPVKSVIDVDVNDAAFKRFSDLFGKYQDAVEETRFDWERVNKTTDKARRAFGAMVKDLVEGRKVTSDIEDQATKSASMWEKLSEHSRRFSLHIKESSSTLIRMGATTAGGGAGAAAGGFLSRMLGGMGPIGWIAALLAGGAAGVGLAGTGKLFGMGERAEGVLGARRRALGLGLSIGEQRSFELNFGQVIDAQGLLQNVADLKRDPTTAWMLGNAAGRPIDLRGDTAQVSEQVIRGVKQLVDRTPESQLGMLLQTHPGLAAAGFDTTQLSALKHTSAADLQRYSERFRQDQKSLGLDDETARKWQESAVNFERTAATLDNTVTKKLTPTLGAFAVAGDMTQSAAQKFSDAVDKFSDAVSHPKETAQAIGTSLMQSQVSQGAINRLLFWNESMRGTPGAFPLNNPGNLRPLGSLSGFRQFPTLAAGVRAEAHDLLVKFQHDHLTTLAQIIAKYAPIKDHNDVKAYIARVSKETGIGASQQLNLRDLTQLAKVIAAQIAVESPRLSKQLPVKVVLQILNEAGGNPNVSAHQAGVVVPQ